MNNLKTIFLIVILYGYSVFMHGQGFKKKYYLQNSISSICGVAIEAPNKNILSIGVTYDTTKINFGQRLTIVGSDANGNVLWRKDYGNNNFLYLANIYGQSITKDNNYFYLTLAVTDNVHDDFSVVIKFNFNGDTIWQKKYYSNQSKIYLYAGAICKGVDNTLLITGFYEDFNAPKEPLLILKVDTNGNEIWRKSINKSIPNTNTGASIIQDKVSKKIIIVGWQYIGNATSYSQFGNIMICDSLGNRLFQTTFSGASGGLPMNQVIQLKDGNFLTGGADAHYLIPNQTTPQNSCNLYKFDINGAIIWTKKFTEINYDNDVANFCELPNEDIVMVGHSDTIKNCNKLQFIKLDKYGNVKYKTYFGSATPDKDALASEISTSLFPTADKGFLLASYFYRMKNPKPYSIIKIDSTGCDTTSEWCRSVALGNDKLNPSTGSGADYRLEMFPNPAGEILNFKCGMLNDKKLSLKIRDVAGREMDTIEIMSAEVLQLNTSEYRAGLYFVSVYLDGRFIETKKLVIEE